MNDVERVFNDVKEYINVSFLLRLVKACEMDRKTRELFISNPSFRHNYVDNINDEKLDKLSDIAISFFNTKNYDVTFILENLTSPNSYYSKMFLNKILDRIRLEKKPKVKDWGRKYSKEHIKYIKVLIKRGRKITLMRKYSLYTKKFGFVRTYLGFKNKYYEVRKGRKS